MEKAVYKTFLQEVTEITAAIGAFVKYSKLYLVLVAGVSWFFSTYDIKGILLFFLTVTTIDTITRINADARNRGLVFNPTRLIFWLQIKSAGLKLWGRKVFVEYGIPVLLTFCIDTLIFKNTLHFNLLTLKLNLPMCSILFFSGVELWSIFENIEDAGHINWLKKGVKAVNGFIPPAWKQAIKILTKKDKDHGK